MSVQYFTNSCTTGDYFNAFNYEGIDNYYIPLFCAAPTDYWTEDYIINPNFNPYMTSGNPNEMTVNPYAVPVEIEQINNVTDNKTTNIRNLNQKVKANKNTFNITDLVSDLAEEDKRIREERKKQFETGQPPEGFTQ